MVIFLSAVQFALIVGILILEYNKKSPAMFLWATVFLMFGVMHFLSCLLGSNNYSDAVLNRASLFVIAFCIIYGGTRVLLLRGQVRSSYPFLSDRHLSALAKNTSSRTGAFYLIVLCAAVLFDILYMAVELGGLGNISWGGTRTLATSYMNFSQIISVLYLLLSGLLLYALMKKKYLLATFTAAVIFLKVIITRNRVEIIPLFACILAYYLIKHSRITLKMVIFCSISACLVIYVVYALRAYRWYGTIDNFVATFNFKAFNAQIAEFFRTDNGELGLRQWFYHFLDGNNNFENFGEFHTYRRILLTFIPTNFSFGLKPPDFAQSMGAAIGMAQGGSMHPTLFGDVYANCGLLGIFMGAFWAAFVTLLDKVLQIFRNDIYLFFAYSVCSYAYVVMGRGAVYNGNVMMMYGLLLLLVVYAFKQKAKNYGQK